MQPLSQTSPKLARKMGGAPLQRCTDCLTRSTALAAEVSMSIPHRGCTSSTTYFVTAGTFCKKYLLQSDRMAQLFCDKLFAYRNEGKFLLHAFVVMPNHVHLLFAVPEGLTLERVMQFIKVAFPMMPANSTGWQDPYGRRASWIGESAIRRNATTLLTTFIRIQYGQDLSAQPRRLPTPR